MRKKLLLRGTLLLLTRPRDWTAFGAGGVMGVVVDCIGAATFAAAAVAAAINSWCLRRARSNRFTKVTAVKEGAVICTSAGLSVDE